MGRTRSHTLEGPWAFRLAMVSGRDSGGRKQIFLQLRGSSLEGRIGSFD
jgi:hypothetical protein